MPKPHKPDNLIPARPARPARVTRPIVTPIPTERPSGFDAFAVAAPGLAPLVAAECVALGITPREVSPAGVSFTATADQLFTANLWSRLTSRVLVRLAEFEARDFATLEKMAARVPWHHVLTPGAAVRLRVTCRKSRLYHSDAVAERVARGITNSIAGSQALGRAKDDEEDDDGNTQLIVVRFDHDRCTISADSSGALLHRRGWRQAIAKAPLRETLAAAMLAACEWEGAVPLVDPFCGSGTIGIEAALRVRRMAPGLGRAFAMEQWPGADPVMHAAVRAAATAVQLPSVGVPIVLRDRDAGACKAALANAERAGVRQDVVIEQGSLSETSLEAIGPAGLVLTNPPYGLRIGDGADLRSLYARLGDVVRAGGRGWQLGLLVPDRVLAGQTRLSFDAVLRTANGGLPVEVLRSRG
ncbi:MAG: class I SAM-dependent RNA methyltransferase [Gemmatimonadota bacterium]|nr:class I SAM-dependent RNA methyltransferase [Gemmatimonadota bacterium]